jgi:hypothetical protein
MTLGKTCRHTIYEPCLYSGLIDGQQVLFMHQVDNFAVAAPDERTANILFDMIDNRLTFPMKQMGLINLFNGLNIERTRDYIKISCSTYIDKIMAKHLSPIGSPPMTSQTAQNLYPPKSHFSALFSMLLATLTQKFNNNLPKSTHLDTAMVLGN